MGCRSNQCSSRVLPIFRKAPAAMVAVSCRLSQSRPAAKPIAPPSRPNPIARNPDRRRSGQLLNTPMHAPMAAGFSALRTDCVRNGVTEFPFKNASRPERAPSSPESRTFRPYSTSDLDHCASIIRLHYLTADRRYQRLLKHYAMSKSVKHVTHLCDASHKVKVLVRGYFH